MTKLIDSEIAELLPLVPGWNIVEEEGMKRLHRTYSFENFSDALKFTNKVGEFAERYDHHPRIVTEWGSVTLTWWSHDLGGLVASDFEMARRVDAG